MILKVLLPLVQVILISSDSFLRQHLPEDYKVAPDLPTPVSSVLSSLPHLISEYEPIIEKKKICHFCAWLEPHQERQRQERKDFPQISKIYLILKGLK